VKLSLLRFSDADQVEGRVTDRQRAEHEQQVRAARLEFARRNPRWVELEEIDLVARDRGLLVSATTDEVFQEHRGVVFDRSSATPIADHAPLAFYVSAADGVLVFLDRQPDTWSALVARRARRGRAT